MTFIQNLPILHSTNINKFTNNLVKLSDMSKKLDAILKRLSPYFVRMGSFFFKKPLRSKQFKSYAIFHAFPF